MNDNPIMIDYDVMSDFIREFQRHISTADKAVFPIDGWDPNDKAEVLDIWRRLLEARYQLQRAQRNTDYMLRLIDPYMKVFNAGIATAFNDEENSDSSTTN